MTLQGGTAMLSYYKSVRLNGTDFHTGELQWAPPEGHEAPWIVYHQSGRQEVPSAHPRDFLSVATVPTDCSGMAWPCRLLQVRPVEGHPVATPGGRLLPNRVVATAWEVIAELDPRLALGPQADQLIALLDTAERLTGDKLRDLAAARFAAWFAAREPPGTPPGEPPGTPPGTPPGSPPRTPLRRSYSATASRRSITKPSHGHGPP